MWGRKLRKLVAAHDEGRIAPQSVARFLAQTNKRVADIESRTVGERCVVAWRFQKGGGADQFFRGAEREDSSTYIGIPTISGGMDMNAIFATWCPFIVPQFKAMLAGLPHVSNVDAVNAELAKLPETPDDTLE